jgi:hypothetical protein
MRSGVAERARRVKLLTLSVLTAVWAGGCGHRGPSGRAAALPPASHVCRPLRSERPATERCETPSGRVWLQSSETVLEDMPDFDSIQSHVVLDALHSYVLSEAVARHGARLLSFVPYEDLNGRCTRAQRFEVAWAGPDGGFAGIIVAASVAPRSGTVAILTCAGRKEEIAAACTPLLRARLASLTCGATRGVRRQHVNFQPELKPLSLESVQHGVRPCHAEVNVLAPDPCTLPPHTRWCVSPSVAQAPQ